MPSFRINSPLQPIQYSPHGDILPAQAIQIARMLKKNSVYAERVKAFYPHEIILRAVRIVEEIAPGGRIKNKPAKRVYRGEKRRKAVKKTRAIFQKNKAKYNVNRKKPLPTLPHLQTAFYALKEELEKRPMNRTQAAEFLNSKALYNKFNEPWRDDALYDFCLRHGLKLAHRERKARAGRTIERQTLALIAFIEAQGRIPMVELVERVKAKNLLNKLGTPYKECVIRSVAKTHCPGLNILIRKKQKKRKK